MASIDGFVTTRSSLVCHSWVGWMCCCYFFFSLTSGWMCVVTYCYVLLFGQNTLNANANGNRKQRALMVIHQLRVQNKKHFLNRRCTYECSCFLNVLW